jgi:hypothetical protein
LKVGKFFRFSKLVKVAISRAWQPRALKSKNPIFSSLPGSII